ncbi:MAG: DUF3108 domain-containing protein, partial [Bacteroidales bacterium]|nr:DUF3108 domain-containing protein [Bacteroidales bacterium]
MFVVYLKLMHKPTQLYFSTFFFCFLLCANLAIGQTSSERAFQRNESLKYWVYYDAPLLGKVYAGKATLELTKDDDQFNGNNTYHAIGTGKSTGTFDFFFKVRDRFESWFDEETLKPYRFVR